MMKNKFILLVCLVIFVLYASVASAQDDKPVSDINFVKIKDGKKAEAMFFYENNWKAFRQVALEKGFIRSYKLLSIPSGTSNSVDFDLMLITEYKDSLQYKAQEENFRPIMKQLSPGGPKLLNELKPKDFATIVFSKKAITEYDK
jgi:hypothetical protein